MMYVSLDLIPGMNILSPLLRLFNLNNSIREKHFSRNVL